MRRIILFSNETPEIMDKVLEELFPDDIKNKNFAYIPSDGADEVKNEKYTPGWREHAEKYGVKQFHYIDNSKDKTSSKDEYSKIMDSNIVLLTGGNTYTFLRNMKRSGLDEAIVDFTKKDEFVLAGYSSGAMILTPTIDLCQMEGFAENRVNLEDTTGIGIVDFEIFPHYNTRKGVYEDYLEITENEVRTINDDEMIILDG